MDASSEEEEKPEAAAAPSAEDQFAQVHGATCDAFLGGRVMAWQPAAGPRSAIDALFLAAACPAEGGKAANVLEAGAGCGVVSLAIAMRAADAKVTGIEVNPALVALAEHNVKLNGLLGRVRVIHGDVTDPPGLFAPRGLTANSYSHVLANPPFYVMGKGHRKKNAAAQRAHMFAPGELAAWIKFLTNCAAAKGSLTLIHRADALPEILRHLERRFGALMVYPLFPRRGAAAIRVLIHGMKGSRAPMRLLRGMILHEENGRYTAAAEAVLRFGERIAWNKD
jgi:tRNA1(Val) A37 N6-methylase TrmN6